jgi:hypothetical protein
VRGYHQNRHNQNAKKHWVNRMKVNSRFAARALLLLWGAAAPALAGTANCPTCSDRSLLWVIIPTYYITYSPPIKVCQDPSTSDLECLTSSQYTASYTYYIHIYDEDTHEWVVSGPWNGTYEPCWNDDTECWRPG